VGSFSNLGQGLDLSSHPFEMSPHNSLGNSQTDSDQTIVTSMCGTYPYTHT